MIKYILPSKDATIYEYTPLINTSLDSILEFRYSNLYNANSRILLDFNTTDIITSIPSGSTANFELKLFADEVYEIPLDFKILAYPISQPWKQGTGKYYDLPNTTDGVNWSGSGFNDWINSGSNFVTQSNINVGGGSWNPNYIASSSIYYQPNNDNSDISINVTEIVNQWITGSIDNYGLILKLENETDLNANTLLQYFSVDSATIYQPVLSVQYDDSSFITGSLNALQSNSKAVIYYKNLQYTYKQNSVVKIELGARNKYTQATFNYGVHPLNQNLYLPENSYYSIVDVSTGDTIIEFSDYTKISCDEDGNYFWLDMSNFNPERIYNIIIKSEFSNGVINTFDNQDFFKVVR